MEIALEQVCSIQQAGTYVPNLASTTSVFLLVPSHLGSGGPSPLGQDGPTVQLYI